MRKAPSYNLSYIQNYDTNNTDQTIAGTFLQKSHQLLEQTLPKVGGVRRVLEVGAGSGHHLPYVSKDFQQYVMTDVSEEMLNIARKKFCAEVSSDSLVIEKQDATSKPSKCPE